jgi:hypothetical protein
VASYIRHGDQWKIMNSSKILSIVIATIATVLVMSSINSANHIFAQKDDTSNSGGGSDNGGSSSSGTSSSSSSSSSKSDYDNFQKCLSDAATGGSATKQQIRDCFDSTYGGSSTSSSGGSSGGNTDNSGSSSDSGSGSNSNDNSNSNN